MSEKQKEKPEENNDWDQPYKCNICGSRVNYTFIMAKIKSSGLCPDCFNKDEEDAGK